MTQYIHKLDITGIIGDLVKFENSLKVLFEEYDMNLRDNLERRNALISALQEKVTALLHSLLTETNHQQRWSA